MNPRRILALTLGLSVLFAAGCNARNESPSANSTVGMPAPTTLPPSVSTVIATDHGPGGFFISADAVYVGNHRGGTLQRIDPATNRLVATLRVGGQLVVEQPAGVDGLLWTCTNVDGVLHLVDLEAGVVTASVPAACDGGSRTVIGGVLWAAPGPDLSDLLVLDVRTGARLRTMPIDPDTWWGQPVAVGGRVVVPSGKGALSCQPNGASCTHLPSDMSWLIPAGGNLYRIPPNGVLTELDPATLKTVKTYTLPTHEDNDISLVGDGAGHVFYRPDPLSIYRLDTATGVVDKLIELPWAEATTGMAWAFGSLWVTNFSNDTVWRINTA